MQSSVFSERGEIPISCDIAEKRRFIVKQKWFEKISSLHIIWICLGVLRTLGFYINFRQLAINGQKYCVLAHAFSPQRAEARLGEEMFINGYALKTR